MSSYGLWINGETEPDVFLVSGGKVITAADIKSLGAIAATRGKKLKADELAVYDLNKIFNLAEKIRPGRLLPQKVYSDLLGFLDIVVDLRRSVGVDDDFDIKDLLNKLFSGCVVARMIGGYRPPRFSLSETRAIKGAIEYGKALVLKHFFSAL